MAPSIAGRGGARAGAYQLRKLRPVACVHPLTCASLLPRGSRMQAAGALHAYGVHAVVANLLHTRKDQVLLVTSEGGPVASAAAAVGTSSAGSTGADGGRQQVGYTLEGRQWRCRAVFLTRCHIGKPVLVCPMAFFACASFSYGGDHATFRDHTGLPPPCLFPCICCLAPLSLPTAHLALQAQGCISCRHPRFASRRCQQ